MRQSVESYAHRNAKQVVVGWLRDAAQSAGHDNYTKDLFGIEWRVNRPGPNWGVYEECPVLSDGTGILPCWDETLGDLGGLPPTYQQLVASGKRPVAIFDIAIQHKGHVVCCIEIVHKHAVSDEKLRRINGLSDSLQLLVLPAKWVLGQIGPPAAPIPPAFWVLRLNGALRGGPR